MGLGVSPGHTPDTCVLTALHSVRRLGTGGRPHARRSPACPPAASSVPEPQGGNGLRRVRRSKAPGWVWGCLHKRAPNTPAGACSLRAGPARSPLLHGGQGAGHPRVWQEPPTAPVSGRSSPWAQPVRTTGSRQCPETGTAECHRKLFELDPQPRRGRCGTPDGHEILPPEPGSQEPEA